MNATPFRALFSNAGPSSVNTGSLPGAPRTTIDLGFLAAACFLICALLGLAGCNGPTKAGKEARSAAHDRMNLISAQVHFDQAKQSFEAGQFEKAMREINRAIMRYPDSPEYHLLQGRIYLETHQLESALMCFSTAAEICDEQLEALAKIDAQGLAVSGDRSPQATRRGESSPQPKTVATTNHQPPITSDFQGAAPRRGSATNSPASPFRRLAAQSHYFKGIVHQRWSDDQRAYDCYQRAYEHEPTNVQYLLAAAESLISLGEFDKAIELITPRLAYFEHNAAMRQLRAHVALLQGDARRAVELYTEARLLNPEDNLLLEQLMWAQYAAGMYGQCHESVKTLQKRLSASRRGDQPAAGGHSDRFDLSHLEARCLAQMNRSIEARDLYLELARLRPADTTIWTELAALAWDLGDYRRVAMASVQIIALAPDRYEGYMFKGINERHRGNLEGAAGLFRQAAEVAATTDPSVALPHLLLGQTLEQLGRVSQAVEAYAAAVQAEPGNPEAAALFGRLAGQVASVSHQ